MHEVDSTIFPPSCHRRPSSQISVYEMQTYRRTIFRGAHTWQDSWAGDPFEYCRNIVHKKGVRQPSFLRQHPSRRVLNVCVCEASNTFSGRWLLLVRLFGIFSACTTFGILSGAISRGRSSVSQSVSQSQRRNAAQLLFTATNYATTYNRYSLFKGPKLTQTMELQYINVHVCTKRDPLVSASPNPHLHQVIR